jgi:hypothetical protein
MANMRYFAECGGGAVRLVADTIHHDGSIYSSAKHFSGICPTCGERHTCTRSIERKANPSNHKCDARCQGARGHRCECACGGAHHGKDAA